MQPFCAERKYNPDDLGDNQLAKFAEHLKDNEVKYDTCRGIASALGWKQRDLERTRGKEAVTWTMRPAETPGFRDLLRVKGEQKRKVLQSGGWLAAVGKQTVSDLQLEKCLEYFLESDWAVPLRLATTIQASTASRFSDVAHMTLSNVAVATLEDTHPDRADVLVPYSALGKHLGVGSTEKHSVVRHINVNCCPVSAIGTAPMPGFGAFGAFPRVSPVCTETWCPCHS